MLALSRLKSIFLVGVQPLKPEADYLSAKKNLVACVGTRKIMRPQLENGICEAEKSLDKFFTLA